MADVMLGSLGVIEEYFGAELGAGEGAISAERISRLPVKQLDRLGTLLAEAPARFGGDKGAERFTGELKRATRRGVEPAMVIAHTAAAGRTRAYGALALEPCRRSPGDEQSRDLFGVADRSWRYERATMDALAAEGLCLTPYVNDWTRRRRNFDPQLVKFALALDLKVEPIDNTADPFIEQYLFGKGLVRRQLTQMSHIGLPRLANLPSTDLAALISTDDALDFVRRTWNDICYGLLDEVDPNQAAKELEDRIAGEFAKAVEQFAESLRVWPGWATSSGTAMAMGAALFAGAATGDPKLATGIAVGGAGSQLAATFIDRYRKKRRSRAALRVLRRLGSPP